MALFLRLPSVEAVHVGQLLGDIAKKMKDETVTLRKGEPLDASANFVRV